MKRTLLLLTLSLVLLPACQGHEQQAVNVSKKTQAENTGAEVTSFQPSQVPPTPERINQLHVPEGFRINVFARDIGNPRMLFTHPDGKIYVTRPDNGDVITLQDTDGDGVSDKRTTVISGLSGVHGIAIRQGTIYLATPGKVLRAPLQQNGKAGPTQTIAMLPPGGRHPKRTLGFDADGKLYVSIGSTCNACSEEDERSAAILRMNPDGSSQKVFASGLRNTIGFGWHPETGTMWGMDIGSDWVGADVPPEELNNLSGGGNYGWPWCYGNQQADTHMNTPPPEGESASAYCKNTKPAVLTHQAHSSPIGMVFYTGEQFPAEYRGDAFIALRGSWNRKPAVGYKVARIDFKNGQPVAFKDFLTGFLLPDGESHFARIAGVTVAPDGSLLISDDTNGMIYRVSYQRNQP